MKKILCLFWAAALPLAASPQTSDADLKAQQSPLIDCSAVVPTYISTGVNLGGARLKFGATLYNEVPADFTNAGSFDLSSVTAISGTGASSVTLGNAGLTISGDAALTALKLVPGSLTTIKGSSAVDPDAGGPYSNYCYFPGYSATIQATGLSTDPCFGVIIIQGGIGLYNGATVGNGGSALLAVTGGTFTTFVSHVSEIIDYGIGAYGGYSPCGGSANLSYASNADLVSLDLSSLDSINIDQATATSGVDCSGCPSLTSVAMASFCETTFGPVSGYGAPGGLITFNGDALGAPALDVILSSLSNAGATTDATNGFPMTLDVSGGTNATPDGTGLGYIAVLAALGWTVTTN